MEIKSSTAPLPLLIFIVCIAVASLPSAALYTNHTVGGAAGWFFDENTGTPSAKYSDWAATQNFSLGDYLIFNTNTNQSVIQTYNTTTYNNCTLDYSEDDDTFSFSGGSSVFNKSLTILVPLTIEGVNYYFSDSDDGVQCEKGMAFEINVKHGSGLPPSLNQPPPPAYVEPPKSNDDSLPPPVTVLATPPPSTGIRTPIGYLHWSAGFITICQMMVILK